MQYTGSGTCVSVSAASPATHDSTGFAALTYTQVGELATLGAVQSTFEMATFDSLCTGVRTKVPGIREVADFEITYALDRDDAGYALLAGAHEDKDIVSLRIVDPQGTLYMTARVMSHKYAEGSDPNAIVIGSNTFSPVPGAGGVITVIV